MSQDASHQDISRSIPLAVDNLFHTSPDTLQEEIFNIFTSIHRKPLSCLTSLTMMMTMLSRSWMVQIIGLGADTPPRLQHWLAVSRPSSILPQGVAHPPWTAFPIERWIPDHCPSSRSCQFHWRMCSPSNSKSHPLSNLCDRSERHWDGLRFRCTSLHRQSCTTSGRAEHPRARRIWPLWRGSRLGPNSAGGNWSELRQRNRWSRLRDSVYSWWMTSSKQETLSRPLPVTSMIPAPVLLLFILFSTSSNGWVCCPQTHSLDEVL